MGRALTRSTWLIALGVSLAACDTLGDMDFFGSSDEDILPGERIAILSLERGLEADARVAEVRVRLSDPYVNQRWTHFGGSPTHAMYHLALGTDPRQAWSKSIGAGSSESRRLLAQPLVVDGVVYSFDALDSVTAYDAERGGVLWRSDIEPEDEDDGYFGGGIAYDEGRIFVATGFASVHALDAASGEVAWTVQVPAPVRAAPVVSGGRLFVITLDNQTIALDAGTGERLWRHSGLQETTGLVGSASPAVDGSTVVAPYSSGEIVGLLAENGRVLWTDSLSSVRRIDPLGDIAHIRGTPVIDRGVVFAISHSGRMVAIDLRRGLRAWETEVGGIEMPWVGGEFIYVITNDAQLVCLTRREGRIRWVQPLPRYEDPEDQESPIHWSGPVLAGDRLILAGSHGEALSISPYTGEVLGQIRLPGGAAVAPVVAGNSLYLLTESGTLIAMR